MSIEGIGNSESRIVEILSPLAPASGERVRVRGRAIRSGLKSVQDIDEKTENVE
jgi:hypothetical protein